MLNSLGFFNFFEMKNLRQLLVGLLIFVFAGSPVFAAYDDVRDGELLQEVIQFLQEKKIGDTSANFYPRRPITLAEFLAMGLTAAGVEDFSGSTSRFSDVGNEDWFAPFIVKAEKLGLLNDFQGDKILPNRPMNRGEVVQLGLEIFGVGVPPTIPDEEFGFRDVRKSHRLARHIFRAVKMGVISPIADDNFGLTKRVDRAEAATLFYDLASFEEIGGTTIVIQNGTSRIPNWELFESVWQETRNKFLFEQSLSNAKMMHSSLQGLVSSLDDPYSEFFTPAQTQVQTSNLSGEFEGIGVYIEKDEGGRGLVIVAPIFNSPADQVGLRAGDIIIGVGGKSLKGLSLEEAANMTRGPSGTTATYQLLREDMRFEVDIIREKIKVDQISMEFRDNVAIFDLNQFTSALPDDFAKIADEIMNQHPRGIVLDLRNNGGGLVTSAVDLLGYFLPEGAIVAQQEFRPELESRNINYNTKRAPILHGFPIMVLVNRGSASASEIVAAALQDHNVASVVGEQTFGKGTVQEISFFPDGSALKLTVAHWLSPRQQPIQGDGVTPDFTAVDNPETPVDEAIDAVLKMF